MQVVRINFRVTCFAFLYSTNYSMKIHHHGFKCQQSLMVSARKEVIYYFRFLLFDLICLINSFYMADL
jgi:hypothetical protein